MYTAPRKGTYYCHHHKNRRVSKKCLAMLKSPFRCVCWTCRVRDENKKEILAVLSITSELTCHHDLAGRLRGCIWVAHQFSKDICTPNPMHWTGGGFDGPDVGRRVEPFPCTYLGLPLGLRKLSATKLQCLVDKVANKLQLWSASMLSSGGRLTLVRSTLCAIPVYSMMSLDLPMKTIDGIDKICRGFLWKGRTDVRGEHCLVAWQSVCSPMELGGLGLPNLSC